MTDKEIKDHYRNIYQIVKKDKDSIERECEELRLLATIQQDLISTLNKRNKELEHSNEVLENFINENIKDKKIHTVKVVKIR